MDEFSLSDLNRRPGELVDIALTRPILLTKRGRRQLVMMSAAAYDALTQDVSRPAPAPSRLPGKLAKLRSASYEDEGE
ncbi:type II toxin-antitoxin system prevent-host-death family antitoxin [Devosia sediminis]|uniref:Antitoxin n=1 Tax=Devosia sediminis TaxID=2798801 RepID=A0A934MSD6_9HYPH|nr:type II toxin-antitoxin system prevent-host-death family antitoxin [Devosia sediminis]MBJ3786349.1 type II toxin-antitoxin system prevent-host-death family antitoxin [Devosia sediminis]